MSPNSLALLFAKRYYHAAYDNPYIKFINRASRLGIAIGVAALIVGLSVMNGFERELKSSLLSVIPDVEFEAVDGKLSDWTATSERLSRQAQVTGVAPYIKLNGMVQQGEQLQAVLAQAVEPSLETQVNKIPSLIISGRWLSVEPGAVIGAGLAQKLDVQVGEKLELLLPGSGEQQSLASPNYLQVPIVGIYQVGGQMDFGQVYLPLGQLQQMLGWQEQHAEGVKVELIDPFSARYWAGRLGSQLSDYVYILDWYRSQGHVYQDIVMVKDIMYLVMILVMAVACFNIVSSLTMAVQEKHGDIGILKTVGMLPHVVRNMFIYMGMMTALRGIAWGLVFGIGISFLLPQLVAILEAVFQFKALDADVYFIDYIPTEVEFLQILTVVFTAFVVALLATLYPARKAAKLAPVELIAGS